jgi:toxin ParE1/3/4
MTTLNYSDSATRDLRGIWEYTVLTWSKAQADKYYMSLIDCCERIARNPKLGRKFEGLSAHYLGYREGRHIIFYRIATPEAIEIVRILHVNMDFKNRIQNRS